MPCMDGGPSAEQVRRDEALQKQREEDRIVSGRLACEYCRMIEDDHGEVPEWAKDWWKRHKIEDEQRVVREALNKLTPAEIKAIKRSFGSRK